MDEVDSRFLHLLQPIRDLTKNWEVDVAAQLAEYLGEVTGSSPLTPAPAVPPQTLPGLSLSPSLPFPAGSDQRFLRQRENHHEFPGGGDADPGLRLHLQQEGEDAGGPCPVSIRCRARSVIPEPPRGRGVAPESPHH